MLNDVRTNILKKGDRTPCTVTRAECEKQSFSRQIFTKHDVLHDGQNVNKSKKKT